MRTLDEQLPARRRGVSRLRVAPPPAQPDVVAELEELAAQARAGQVQMLGVVVARPGGSVSTVITGESAHSFVLHFGATLLADRVKALLVGS